MKNICNTKQVKNNCLTLFEYIIRLFICIIDL